MFLTESFGLQLDDLLERVCRKLQITASQHKQAEECYVAIGNWLQIQGSPLAPYRPLIYPQGSLGLGTTVKPIAYNEYDLDIVCEVQIDWRKIPNPVDLLNAVEKRIKENEIYKPMVKRKNRCIRIDYANEFHMDILPACPDTSAGNGCLVVPDRAAKKWKASNPKGYANWFGRQSKIAKALFAERVEPIPPQESIKEKATLKQVVQLLKRWRDIAYKQNQSIAPISIILTTLAGHYYQGDQSVNDAMTNLLNSIVANLPTNGHRLRVLNPANLMEDLSERWDEIPGAYDAFASGMRVLQAEWSQVNGGRGIHQVGSILGRLFGETIAREVIKEQVTFINDARSKNGLATQKTSGMLSGIGGANVVPVRPNTFYGE